MRMTLFTDLDGPVLEVSDRYYAIHAELCRELGLPPLGKDEYWQAKRSGYSEKRILNLADGALPHLKYHSLRSERIESYHYLLKDRLQPNVSEWLRQTAKNVDLVVVTLRKHSQRTLEQLRNLSTLERFKEVLCVGGQGSSSPAEAKANAIRAYLEKSRSASPLGMVGDSEADMRAAKLCHIPSIAVLNGIRSLTQLQQLEPTFTLDSLASLQIDSLITTA